MIFKIKTRKLQIQVLMVLMTLSPSIAKDYRSSISSSNHEVRFEKALSKKKAGKLIGEWQFAHPSGTFILNIREVQQGTISKTGEKLGAFTYDLIQNGVISDSVLTGFISGRRIYFNASFIDGFSFFTATFDKKIKSAKYVEVFINDSLCEDTGLIDNDTGANIHTCIFGASTVEDINSGTMIKI